MDDCPLCCNALDDVEREATLCSNSACTYQLCFFCYKGIFEQAEKDLSRPRCPNCREVYDMSKIKLPNPQSSRKPPQVSKKKDVRRKKVDLMDVRVIQRNLVYAVGLAPELCTEQTLKGPDYFGKYGKIRKISVSMSRPCGGSRKRSTGAAYVVFHSKEDALRCIHGADGQIWSGQAIRTCYATTKYCHAFLKGVPCGNPDCLYLHELSDGADCITKDDMHPVHGRKEILRLINPGGMGKGGVEKGGGAVEAGSTQDEGPAPVVGSVTAADEVSGGLPAVTAASRSRTVPPEWPAGGAAPRSSSLDNLESLWPSLGAQAPAAAAAARSAATHGVNATSAAARAARPSAKDVVAGKVEVAPTRQSVKGASNTNLVTLSTLGRSPARQASASESWSSLPPPPGLLPVPRSAAAVRRDASEVEEPPVAAPVDAAPPGLEPLLTARSDSSMLSHLTRYDADAAGASCTDGAVAPAAVGDMHFSLLSLQSVGPSDPPPGDRSTSDWASGPVHSGRRVRSRFAFAHDAKQSVGGALEQQQAQHTLHASKAHASPVRFGPRPGHPSGDLTAALPGHAAANGAAGARGLPLDTSLWPQQAALAAAGPPTGTPGLADALSQNGFQHSHTEMSQGYPHGHAHGYHGRPRLDTLSNGGGWSTEGWLSAHLNAQQVGGDSSIWNPIG